MRGSNITRMTQVIQSLLYLLDMVLHIKGPVNANATDDDEDDHDKAHF